jgi:hypothetical protein
MDRLDDRFDHVDRELSSLAGLVGVIAAILARGV